MDAFDLWDIDPATVDERTLKAYGVTREGLVKIQAENTRILKERGDKLPDTDEGIDELLDEIPLFAAGGETAGKTSDDFQALHELIEGQTPDDHANRLKDNGNSAFKMARIGAKHKPPRDTHRWADALAYYEMALNYKGATDTKLKSSIYSNRGLAHLCRESYGYCIEDCKKALRLNHGNLKAYSHLSKALRALRKSSDALKFAKIGLTKAKLPKDAEALQKLVKLLEQDIDRAKQKLARKEEAARKKVEEEEARVSVLQQALAKRKITIGPSMFKDTERKPPGYDAKPFVDDQGLMHWPVFFLYPRAFQSDFVRDWREDITVRAQLEAMLPPKGPWLPWDRKKEYHVKNLKLYVEVGSKRIAVTPYHTLKSILCRTNYIVPGVPAICVEPRKSS